MELVEEELYLYLEVVGSDRLDIVKYTGPFMVPEELAVFGDHGPILHMFESISAPHTLITAIILDEDLYLQIFPLSPLDKVMHP
jgi:hypothetical protein